MRNEAWIDHNMGDTPPSFYPDEVIEIQYHSGRRVQADRPWEASGWNHVSENWPNNIVKYRFVTQSKKRK